MQHFRRNWRLTGAAAVLILGGGLWWGIGGGGQAAADPEPPAGYPPVTDQQRAALGDVMDDVGLDRDALVALNLTGQQAEDVLAAARTWWEQHAATLETLQATIDARGLTVRSLRASIRMGPAQQGQDQALATAIAELLTARTTYQQGLVSLRSTATTHLSESQRAAWASVERGHSKRMPIRLLDLNGQQRLAVGRAWQAYRLTYAVADSVEERAAARTAWATALESILTNAQESVADAYLGYWVSSSQAVVDAMDTVLPPVAS